MHKNKYNLISILSAPFSGHFTAFLINYEYGDYLIKKNNNYIYDDLLNKNIIVEIESNFDNFFNDNIPYILIYEKDLLFH